MAGKIIDFPGNYITIGVYTHNEEDENDIKIEFGSSPKELAKKLKEAANMIEENLDKDFIITAD